MENFLTRSIVTLSSLETEAASFSQKNRKWFSDDAFARTTLDAFKNVVAHVSTNLEWSPTVSIVPQFTRKTSEEIPVLSVTERTSVFNVFAMHD